LKKILHVVNVSFVIPYYLGDQIKFFNDNGNIIFIACTNDDNLIKYSKKWNFTPFKLNISRKISPLHDLFSIIKLYKFIRDNKIDTVIGHTPKGAFIAIVSSFFAKAKIRIYFRHGLMFETSKGLKKIILILVEKITSQLSTKVICVSKSVLDRSIKLKLSNPDKLLLINNGTCNGIDAKNLYNRILINNLSKLDLCEKYNISKDTKIIGYIGRLAKDKGMNELILAWENIHKNSLNAKLMLCGPIDDRDPINKNLLRKIQSNNSIIYVGEVDNPTLYYSIFYCFILPSYREGFPTVVLEASSMQLPIITTKSTGCIDSIIENETGIFTKIDPESISEKILFYLNNEQIAKCHGENGRNFVLKNFDQKCIWNSLNKIYSNA
jgi:glycosyltransferase involved in cell wall biosynthesis